MRQSRRSDTLAAEGAKVGRMPPIKNALTIDFEDWYQPFSARSVQSWKNFGSRVPHETSRMLSLLDRLQVRATFFVVGQIAELYPDAIRAISRCGHEIGSHGYRHEPLFAQERTLFECELRGSRELLQDLTGEPVRGFRAPFFSLRADTLWATESLRSLGFEYSSSVHPTASFLHGYPGGGRLPFRHPNGLREFPITTLSLGGVTLPFGGGLYYRLLPYGMIRCGLRWLNRRNRSGVLYFHPRELDPDLPRLKTGPALRLIVYAGVRTLESKLSRLAQEFRFVPLREM